MYAKGNQLGIESNKKDITITDARVTAIAAGNSGTGANTGIRAKNVTISGEKADVRAEGNMNGIRGDGGNISITDAKVTIIGRYGLITYKANITIDGNAEVNITSKGESAVGIFINNDSGNIIISGAKVSVTATATYAWSCGICTSVGNITITDAEVTTTGVGDDSFGIENGPSKNLTISGDSTVVTAEGKKAAISVGGKIEIKDSLGIFEPTDGTLGTDKKHVYKSDGTTAATKAVIKTSDPAASGMTYTVTWLNYNGAVLETDTNVPYGTLPTYNGLTPYRPSTSAYIYTFSGWTPSVAPVTGNVTYTADYTAVPNFTPGIPGGTIPGIPGGTIPGIPGGTIPGIPGLIPGGIPGFTPGGTPGTTPGTDPGSTPGTDPGSTPGGETGLPFADVSPDSPYLEDIQFVYENDLMIGMSDTEFGENLPLTRGMIVTVLHRMEGKPDVTYSGVFTDVPAGEWYTDGVEWAASHGIVLGYGNGKYGPNDNVTREQLAAILFRYANWKGYDTSIGEDTNILSYNDAFTWGDWAVPALQWACGTGVLEDVPAGMLRPTEPAARGEIAHAIRVFCEEVAS